MTDLRLADLRAANLSGVDLLGANLTTADLRGAEFRVTVLAWTILGNVDLTQAKGVDQVRSRARRCVHKCLTVLRPAGRIG